MDTYPRNKYDGGHLERCAICNAMVAGWAEENSVCASCGMTLVEPPFRDSDYVDMIMRADRPLGRAARRRHPHSNTPPTEL